MYSYFLYIGLFLFCCTNTNPISIDLENGLTYGMYVVKAKVGSSNQMMRLHFDTGSSLTVIPSVNCIPCRINGHTLFNPTNSTSYEKIACTSSLCDAFSCNSNCKYASKCNSFKCCDGTDSSYCGYYVQYADESTTEGGLSQDVISLTGSYGDTRSVKAYFGLVFSESGTWQSFADGLMGSSYGYKYGNPTVTPTWFDSYIEANPTIPDIFSTCFGREKGILSVGGLDKTLLEGSIYYADIQDSYFFTIRMNDLRLDNTTLLSKAYSAVLDSGTTYTYVPSSVFSKLRNLFMERYSHLPLANGKIFDQEVVLTKDPSSTWPTIEFYFDGFFVSVPPSVYFFKIDTGSIPVWAFGIAPSSNSYFLLGDTFMGAFTIIHDKENGIVGFAVPSSKCFHTGQGSINETAYTPPVDIMGVLFLVVVCICVVVICSICCCVITIRRRVLKRTLRVSSGV